MVPTCPKHVKCFVSKKNLFDKKWLKTQYQQCHPIKMKEALLPAGILPPADWDQPKPSWFDFSRCTWMAIDELVNNWSNHRHCTWCATTWSYTQWRNYRPPEAWSVMYPWPNNDKISEADSWSGQCGMESKWQSNWIVQQASQVLRTVESMASISVSTQLSTGSII